MTDVLFDTTFFVDLRRGRRDEALAYWANRRDEGVRCCYSPISAYEIWVGGRVDRDEELYFLAVFSELIELPLTFDIATATARWLRGMQQELTARLFRDALIAATATAINGTVCTHNVRDFARFPVQIESY